MIGSGGVSMLKSTMLYVSHPCLVSLSFYTIRICLFFKFAGFVYLLASTHVVIKLLCISEEGGKSPIKI